MAFGYYAVISVSCFLFYKIHFYILTNQSTFNNTKGSYGNMASNYLSLVTLYRGYSFSAGNCKAFFYVIPGFERMAFLSSWKFN